VALAVSTFECAKIEMYLLTMLSASLWARQFGQEPHDDGAAKADVARARVAAAMVVNFMLLVGD